MIFLNCPFNEKDECKALGGKWTYIGKVVCSDGIDASVFKSGLKVIKEAILAHNKVKKQQNCRPLH